MATSFSGSSLFLEGEREDPGNEAGKMVEGRQKYGRPETDREMTCQKSVVRPYQVLYVYDSFSKYPKQNYAPLYVYDSFYKFTEQNYTLLYVYDSFTKYPKQNYSLLYVYDSFSKYPKQNYALLYVYDSFSKYPHAKVLIVTTGWAYGISTPMMLDFLYTSQYFVTGTTFTSNVADRTIGTTRFAFYVFGSMVDQTSLTEELTKA